MLFFVDEGWVSFLWIVYGEFGVDLVCLLFVCMVGIIKLEDGVLVKIVVEYFCWGLIIGSVSLFCFVLFIGFGDFLLIMFFNREGNLVFIDKDCFLEVVFDIFWELVINLLVDILIIVIMYVGVEIFFLLLDF